METDLIIDSQDLVPGNSQERASAVVFVLGVGNQGVQAIVAACHLNDHKDPAIRNAGPRRDQRQVGRVVQRVAGAGEKGRHGHTHGRHGQALFQELSPGMKIGFAHRRRSSQQTW